MHTNQNILKKTHLKSCDPSSFIFSTTKHHWDMVNTMKNGDAFHHPKEATCKCAYMNMKYQLNYFNNRLSITHAKVHPKIAWMHHLAAEKKVKNKF